MQFQWFKPPGLYELLFNFHFPPTDVFYEKSEQLRQIKLFAMADAAYVPGRDSKSKLGFTFFLNLNSGTICAKSKRDTTISHSSTEAEIKAIDMAVIKALWFRGFLEELGFPQTEPTEIITDNHAAKIISDQNSLTEKTAHIVMRINFIHQEIESGTIKLKWINTENNVSDILTKPLFSPFPLFNKQHNYAKRF